MVVVSVVVLLSFGSQPSLTVLQPSLIVLQLVHGYCSVQERPVGSRSEVLIRNRTNCCPEQ